jgi:hypothetical protein
VAQLVEALRYKREGRGFDYQWCHEHGLQIDVASNRNEYKEYFLWGKGTGLTNLPPCCAECLEMWEPQPLGTLGSCKEVVLRRPSSEGRLLQWQFYRLENNVIEILCTLIMTPLFSSQS